MKNKKNVIKYVAVSFIIFAMILSVFSALISAAMGV